MSKDAKQRLSPSPHLKLLLIRTSETVHGGGGWG